MITKNTVYHFALGLLIIGGLNWGLVGAFNFDLVAYIFGVLTIISRVVYILVGISALYIAVVTLISHDSHDIRKRTLSNNRSHS